MATKVYLDFNKWVDLARADRGDATHSRFRDALTIAKEGVRLGLASFPLSADHYMELGARSSADSRYQLARMMLRLSKGQVMAGLTGVVPAEVDRTLKAIFGRPLEPRSGQIFKLTIFEALGAPDRVYHIPDGVNLIPTQEAFLADLIRYFLLAGPPDGVVIPDFEPQAYRGPGRKFAEEQRELTRRMAGTSPEVKRELLIAKGFLDIAEPLKDALTRAGLPADVLATFAKDRLIDLLRSIPTRWAEFEMLYQHHLNPALPWRDNDLVDVTTLSVALVYCDVVVAEKFWVDMARRAHLDDLYSVKLLTSLENLAPTLSASTQLGG